MMSDTDRRPHMTVYMPGQEFIAKYIDRHFDRNVLVRLGDDPGVEALMLSRAVNPDTAAEATYREWCAAHGIKPRILRLAMVIGTGMAGFGMTLARGVARGTMLVIRDNVAVRSAIHCVDIPRVIERLPQDELTLTVAGPPVSISELVCALGKRIKDKRVGSIKPRWARLLYGSSLYGDLTRDQVTDTADLEATLGPDFVFTNIPGYLTTHVYDDESL